MQFEGVIYIPDRQRAPCHQHWICVLQPQWAQALVSMSRGESVWATVMCDKWALQNSKWNFQMVPVMWLHANGGWAMALLRVNVVSEKCQPAWTQANYNLWLLEGDFSRFPWEGPGQGTPRGCHHTLGLAGVFWSPLPWEACKCRYPCYVSDYLKTNVWPLSQRFLREKSFKGGEIFLLPPTTSKHPIVFPCLPLAS